MAKSMTFITATLVTLLPATIDAGIVWDTTYGKDPARRLALGTANSHSNASDPNCIVGGYDPDHPTRIYVGGPCSLIENSQPKEGFRYIVMQTFHADLQGKGSTDTTDMKAIPDAEFQYSLDQATHAEAGAGVSVHFGYPGQEDIAEACMFLSTTSYLSKSDFTFTKNSFVVSKTGDMVRDVCVKPCAGTPPVQCTSCPANDASDAIPVTKGQYKYSILAAAFNVGTTAGWQQVKAKYKDATSGQLEGYLNVYQAIDFTNMNADTLTIAGTSSTVKYKDMVECNLTSFKTTDGKECTLYSIAKATIDSDGWSGTYEFPLSYNYGSWSTSSGTAEPVPSHEGTKTVSIMGVKPMAKDLAWMGTNPKAIYIRYQFDISGVEATGPDATTKGGTGKYIVYDPTVKTTQPGQGAGTSSGNSGSTSAGRIACEPVVGLFTIMVMAVFSIFV